MGENTLPPTSAQKIREAHQKTSTELTECIKDSWSDNSLLESDELYGQQWLRGMTLTVLINHEIHHRAQMTVLLRQAGQKVLGILGPAKEDWSKFGMEKPAY